MSIRTEQDLLGVRRAAKLVAATLAEVRRHLRPGVTTGYLDDIAARFIRTAGGRPAPALFVKYPATICISVNEQAVHGLPGPRELAPGDLVKLDVAIELDGYVADAAISIPLPPMNIGYQRLCFCAESALRAGIRAARPGEMVCEIGRAVDREVRRHGFSVVRSLGGHGVGRAMWEEPHVPNFHDTRHTTRLFNGLVLTIEPIITAGARTCRIASDNWTVVTSDGSASAHVEHTIVINDDRPLVLTAA